MALWTPPVLDSRFLESDGMPVSELMPIGSEVIAMAGDLHGCKGVVVGQYLNAVSGAVKYSACFLIYSRLYISLLMH